MAAFVNTSRVVLLGAAWTGTAPGLPGTQTISGTITTSQDLSAYVRSNDVSTSAAMQDGTTFGNGGFVVQYPGLQSGDDITLDIVADFAAATVYPIITTTLGGLGALVYLDFKPASGSRSATNPSFVAAAYISGWSPIRGAVGDLASHQLTLTVTGKFGYLTS
jgi:hypothetical protein